jgi:propanol-preferring alcohol dehydrogenase
MRACLLHHPAPVESAPLDITEVPKPVPRAEEALVKVAACGVCRTDLHVTEGELAVRRSPVIPGHQVVGVVEQCGPEVADLKPGARVGVAWLHRTCGRCEYCRTGKENLCDAPEFTGWTVDGGYAEYIVAPAAYVYPIPEGFEDLHAAPLLCAGIIGYRSLRLSGIQKGGRLGLYGFGAAAHVAIQAAQHWGVEVFVCTRDERHRKLAAELGAVWVGGTTDKPPVQLDAAIVFAPAGEIVPAALATLKKGGTVALGGIHMSDIPSMPYDLLYGERVVRSVANNTREDGREFLALAAEARIRTHTEIFPLSEANRALKALKNDAIRGAAVLTV